MRRMMCSYSRRTEFDLALLINDLVTLLKGQLPHNYKYDNLIFSLSLLANSQTFLILSCNDCSTASIAIRFPLEQKVLKLSCS